MSDAQHDDRTYDKFCKPQFDEIKADVKTNEKDISDMKAVLHNGLRDKVEKIEKDVDRVEKEVKWILRILVVTVLGVLAQLLISSLT
jgi:uncharacterized FlaG/YvyC family protein